MTGNLPVALRQAVDRLLDGVSRKELGRQSAWLSQHYRSGGASALAIASPADVLPYVVSRLPATFAATLAVLAEARHRAGEFQPRDLLDVGAGPGTASWAAVEIWPALETVTMLDSNRHFLDVAAGLASASSHPALAQSRPVRVDMSEIDAQGLKADLVIASFALAEMSVAHLPRSIAGLWEACRGILVLIEPGTPAGFARIRQAREALIEYGAELVAPCPHALACPIIELDWCHFSQRLPRSRDHRLAKSASLPFEDEKFSYVAAARPGIRIRLPAARVLALPRIGKADIGLKLCKPTGIEDRVVARRDSAEYARARRLRWGGGVEGS